MKQKWTRIINICVSLQYADCVEVLAPESLRGRIVEVLKHANEGYKPLFMLLTFFIMDKMNDI